MRKNNWLTIGSLGALVLAALVGSVMEANKSHEWLIWSDFLGKVWIVLLLFLVIPLVCAYVFHTTLSMGKDRVVAKAGLSSLGLHVLIMIAGVGFTFLGSIFLLEVFPPNKIVSDGTLIQATDLPTSTSPFYLETILIHLDNLQGALGMLIIGLMVASFAIGLLAAFWSIPSFQHLKRNSELMGVKALSWLNSYFTTLPVAVFFLTLSLMVKAGINALGLAMYFMLGLSALLLAYTIVLYLFVFIGAGQSFTTFGKGILPTQIAAISTRSSMATIPAMVLACKDYFNLPPGISSLLVTFNTTIFRVSKSVSNTFEYLFLCFIYDMPLEPITFLSFIGVQLLSSFITPGIPRGSKFSNLPIFIAFGIPMEGYILIKSVDAIPDIFKTVVNVTEIMALVMLVKNKLITIK